MQSSSDLLHLLLLIIFLKDVLGNSPSAPHRNLKLDEHIPGNPEEPEKKEETEKEFENNDLNEEIEDTESDIDTRLEAYLTIKLQ